MQIRALITKAMSSPLLQTNSLSIGYSERKRFLYSDLNLSLKPGSLTCLMGPNGTGKSTLLKTLTGIIKPLSGEISYKNNSKLILNPKECAKTFSIVLTEPIPTSFLNVYQIISLGRFPYGNWFGQLKRKDKEVIDWAVKAVGVQDLLDRKINRLSDGERQRVLIGRALAQKTPIVFLDEPTAFLDLPHRIEIIHILRSLTRESNLSILLSTHDLDLVLNSADELWLLSENQNFFTGSPEDLLLSSKLEETFSRKDLSFDKLQGTFHSERILNRFADLSGEPIGVQWTKNALEKVGIGCNQKSSDLKIKVQQIAKNTYEWKVVFRKKRHKSNSIADLLLFINELSLND